MKNDLLLSMLFLIPLFSFSSGVGEAPPAPPLPNGTVENTDVFLLAGVKWKIGEVKVEVPVNCTDCKCVFAGAPTLTENLPHKNCLVDSSVIIYSGAICGGENPKLCPQGIKGDKIIVTYKCCIAFSDTMLCDTYSMHILSCSSQ